MSILTEENGVYCIDSGKALWETDNIHECYSKTGTTLNDVDFVLEMDAKLLLVEYKNATIPGASHPEAFQPLVDKKIDNVVKKYYDSLHYLALIGKNKPKDYIYILEYPGGDSVTRKAVRNIIKKKLPFKLQSELSDKVKLIDKIEVLSIKEWNEHEEYGNFPIKPVKLS